jgi:hypothetical protein
MRKEAPPARGRACAMALALTLPAALAVGCSCSNGTGVPDRSELIALARQGDPTLDDTRAGCIVDALTVRLGADRAASLLQTHPPETLAPADTDAASAAGMGCSGAAGVTVPSSR